MSTVAERAASRPLAGRTLAFGPGHLSGTAPPGAIGNAVISGHRDTHFAFLSALRVGDGIVVEGRDGRHRRRAADARHLLSLRRSPTRRSAALRGGGARGGAPAEGEAADVGLH